MNIYEADNIRITVITPCLIRVEKGMFTDSATQRVQNRDLGEVSYEIKHSGDRCTVRTKEAAFCIDMKKGKVITVTLRDGTVVRNLRKGTLPGTARTLDTADGKVKLEDGIMSRGGVGIMDDSASLPVSEEGGILPRGKCSDVYYFAYGHDYLRQLNDFFRLTGEVPLIPRFALGNWWSRYKAYTQEEYQTLMQKFIDRRLPITVATIDMDWHWTDVVKRFGRHAKPKGASCKEELFYNSLLQGWTGYTWNTELFPDHTGLLDWLHRQGFRVTLNVHPSQGVRFFEDGYEAVCRRMGKDPSDKKAVPFDAADPKFMEAYFEELHYPLEREGVDFWWIDWQQGTKTKIPGLDPLWALNYYHTKDSAKGNRRPLILSRYAGLGSHRFPLGFSGDTICTWKSLDFQPYFTNCAANSGYTWWSHDIGGHMNGIQDDELYLRWLQYGVFSPINRLHSSNSDYMGKEPWKRSWATEQAAERFLRLRHRLIPYIYTANYRTHRSGEPVCMPMYYRYHCEDAYRAKNQYIFGGSLLVCPITKPADRRLNMAYADVWLPQGEWTDIFSGRRYKGGRWVRMYRDMDSIPVLAPEGAIVPMYLNGESNDISLSQPLEINIWRGSGRYELYEDDGETMEYNNGRFAVTSFEVEESEGMLRIVITPPKDSFALLPESRIMHIRFRDVQAGDICVEVSDEPVVVEVPCTEIRQGETAEDIKCAILTRVQGRNGWKNRRFGRRLPKFVRDAVAEIDAMCISAEKKNVKER